MSDMPTRAVSSSAQRLPHGVNLRRLVDRGGDGPHGTLLFCREWAPDTAPIQWNLVHSRANTLRGVHVHVSHWDYLCVLEGEMLLGLHDMRPDSPTYRQSALRSLCGDQPSAIAIPPGVAHGFYFAAAATYVYGVSEYWNPADELGCLWNDAGLRLDWPTAAPLLSPRDSAAPSFAQLARQFVETTEARKRH